MGTGTCHHACPAPGHPRACTPGLGSSLCPRSHAEGTALQVFPAARHGTRGTLPTTTVSPAPLLWPTHHQPRHHYLWPGPGQRCRPGMCLAFLTAPWAWWRRQDPRCRCQCRCHGSAGCRPSYSCVVVWGSSTRWVNVASPLLHPSLTHSLITPSPLPLPLPWS